MKPDILITDTLLLADPGEKTLIPNACVVISGDRISYAGAMAACADTRAKKTINGRGKLTMPGLINLHGHAPMTLFRGLADDLPLADWLNNHIFPAEARHVNPEMVYWCATLAAAEMILSGTTTAADGYFHEHDVARAFGDSGLRAIAAQGIIDFPAPGVPEPEKNIEKAAAFIAGWQKKNSLIRPALFAHSPYTCSNATLKKAKQLARETGVQLYIHVAETEHEYALINEPLADSPIKHLQALDILDEETICVHCVWTDTEDLEILAGQGSPVVLCPQSHLKLASGMAHLPMMLEKKIKVGLGTDGCASNNSLDMFREMDICAKLQKLHSLDPTAVPASVVLKMATTVGADITGFPGHTATLAPGKPADLILLDLQQPHLQPLYSPDLLVYAASGSDVQTVIINGRIVLEEGSLLTIDIKNVLDRVRSLVMAS
jgi:5-methylthioadenosine/S-adenosylhomocysteine deaminase